jgi:hydrogenase nickel incorporation protein HypB
MCVTCGCAEGETKIEGEEHAHSHTYVQVYGDAHGHSHAHGQTHAHGSLVRGHSHKPVSRMVQVEQDILAKNNQYAAVNRRHFTEHGIFALNLVSSPGSGKTTLLCATIDAFKQRENQPPLAVIEGDQQTSNDADRIRATGAAAIQINTGKGCHLDAHMVGHALEKLPLADNGLLLIENVGNLVCPAAFDLGEAHKVAILAVTEGEDKPLKYPDMFAAANVMLLNKVDLLPYLKFDVALCIEYARRINPGIRVILTSAVSGEGIAEWQDWLDAGLKQASVQKPS